ncbi:MAG: DinB family protein [Thermicanus sp.]|nr:DinB family protein [Thermicanus sp.]
MNENEWFVSAKVALQGITAEEAAWTPPGKGNTIWQIVNHLTFWNEDVIFRLRGMENPAKAESNEVTFGDPGDPHDEKGWEDTLKRFFAVMEELKEVVEGLDEERLDQSYRPGSPAIARLLGNIMMHDTYHLGQIVLLRKIRNTCPGFDWV